MLHPNFPALSSAEPELLPIKVLRCGDKEFALFYCCDLDLDPMAFIYEPDPYPLNMLLRSKNELSTHQGFRQLSYYRHTADQTTDHVTVSAPTIRFVQRLMERYQIYNNNNNNTDIQTDGTK